MSAGSIAVTAAALAVGATFLVSRQTASFRTRLIPVNEERVVIIGASSGIGKEIARIYASRHAHLVLVARRKQLLDTLISDELHTTAGSVHAIQADITNHDDVQRLTRESLTVLRGGVDTLIICAGVISVLPFEQLAGIDSTAPAAAPSTIAPTVATIATTTTTSPSSSSSTTTTLQEQIDQLLPKSAMAAVAASRAIMEINYHAPLNLASHFLLALKQSSRAGNIIVVSSMAGKVGAPTRSIYCGSKHAAQGFFEALGLEVERAGVHVGIVSPGTVDTDLRLSAVDLPKEDQDVNMAVAAGTKKGAISARICAEGIIDCSDERKSEVLLPWFYNVSLYLELLSPRLVRYLAKKKYGFL
ncbi:hypothetical protein DFQ27_008981 [Actinomortierella ambigua]|uniref:Uncharacterized protein n=1 Tax=Actinomortierella ambigua TaxID=1343610 RepID=A0A9P6TXP2_9FUNG|nr:hypothetical protein DFQ27_008981 [Actinomortierella ambigua]